MGRSRRISGGLRGGLNRPEPPAIIEWLEERYPTPPLLPADPDDRARVRALAAIVGCDIHPISRLAVHAETQ